MKHLLPIAALLALLPAAAVAQSVGIGTTTPDAKSALEIRASDKGLLIPRLTETQRLAITSPPQGLMVYQTDGTTSGGAQTGFWYYAGTGGWVYLIPDNLGNHTATQNLNLTDKLLVGGTAAVPGTQGLKVDGTGRVGIGLGAAVAPTEQLQVDGGNVKIGLSTWSSTASDRLLKFGDNSFVTLGETDGDDLLQFRAKDFRFNASSTGYTGNVGIGLGAAVAPGEQLEVGGNVKITGTAGTNGLIFPDGTKQTTAVVSSGGLTLPYSGTASTTGSVFQITNSGAGIGLRGASASGQGVVGRVNGTGAGQGVVGVKGTTVPNIEDAGVVGLSDADYAVYARSSQNAGVFGVSDGTAANLAGVVGSSTATSGVGVYGYASGTGVLGAGTNGAGVEGSSSANLNTTAGVVGRNTSGGGAVGVLGTTTSGYGVRGVASASGGYGVQGVATDSYALIGTSGSGVGAQGTSTSSFGVRGNSNSNNGVYGNSSTNSGVYGTTAAGNTGGVAGVEGNSSNSSGTGVLGTTGSGYGVRGEATGSSGYGVSGTATGSNGYALIGSATGAANGLYATSSGTGRTAYFNQTGTTGTANVLEVQNSSVGSTAFFNQSNASNTANAVAITSAGSGTALAVQATRANTSAATFVNTGSDATVDVANNGSAGDLALTVSNSSGIQAGITNSARVLTATTGGNSNMLPVAYGRIKATLISGNVSNGVTGYSKTAGTDNWTVASSPLAGFPRITFTSSDLSSTGSTGLVILLTMSDDYYISGVTNSPAATILNTAPAGSFDVKITTMSDSDIRYGAVYAYDPSRNPPLTGYSFNFVVYKR